MLNVSSTVGHHLDNLYLNTFWESVILPGYEVIILVGIFHNQPENELVPPGKIC